MSGRQKTLQESWSGKSNDHFDPEEDEMLKAALESSMIQYKLEQVRKFMTAHRMIFGMTLFQASRDYESGMSGIMEEEQEEPKGL